MNDDLAPAPAPGYDPIARLFHWGMAAAILCQWALGHVIDLMPRGAMRADTVGVHRTVGVLILVLAFGRLAWRVVTPPPPFPEKLSRPERIMVVAGHAVLYLLVFSMAVGGILMFQSAGRDVVVFGVVLPPLVGEDDTLRGVFKAAHSALGWVFATVLAGHVGAALYHHFILKDGILRRMLPGGK